MLVLQDFASILLVRGQTCGWLSATQGSVAGSTWIGAKRGLFRKRRSTVHHKHPRGKDAITSAVEQTFELCRNNLSDRVTRKYPEGHEKNSMEPRRSKGPSSFHAPKVRDPAIKAKTRHGQGRGSGALGPLSLRPSDH